MSRLRRFLRHRLPRPERGADIVEMALITPFLLFFILGCIQFAILFETYLSVMNAARDAGRWLSVHPHTLDNDTTAAVNARLPSNISSSRLTLTYTPACTTLTSGRCSNRPVDSQIQIAFSYNASNVVFLPVNFRVGAMAMTIPTTLPTYTIYMKVEPS